MERKGERGSSSGHKSEKNQWEECEEGCLETPQEAREGRQSNRDQGKGKKSRDG